MRVWTLVLLGFLAIIFFVVSQSFAQAQSTSNKSTKETTSAGLSDQYFTQGNVLFDQGNYSKAIPFYDKALSIDPTNATILYNKALSLDRLGNTTQAISYYDKVLAINPNDTFTLNNLGLVFDSLGKHDQAISYYDKLLAINPNDTDALYNKGVALDSLGKFEQAISYFDSVVAINANDTDALYQKGVALDSLGKHDEAMSYYDKVLAIDPSYTDALNKKNLTYNNAGTNQIQTVQRSDQALFVSIGAGVIAVIVGYFVITRGIKGKKLSLPQVSQKVSTLREEEKTVTEKNKDDIEWKGI